MADHVLLTAADPEPPAGTIVRDDTGCRWVRQPGRVPCGWISEHDAHAVDPESWRKVAGNYGPVVVLSMPPQPEVSASPMPELAQQIRERLSGWHDIAEVDAALLAVLELHKPIDDGSGVLTVCCTCSHESDWSRYLTAWPCPTVRGIAAALGIAIHESRIEGSGG